MGKYFDKFPVISYNGSTVRNIMAKVNFTPKSRRDILLNFDYVLDDSTGRADNLSDLYYNSPYYDWLIYMANDVVDPYHDYYKNYSQMEAFLISKYGSLQESKKIILFYRNNWSPDDGRIEPFIFDNLSPMFQKYYKPVLTNSNQVIGYIRKQEDWIVSTNKIISLTLNDVSGLSLGDAYIQNNASGKIMSISGSMVILENIKGSFIVDTNILEINIIKENIADVEASFWSPVTAYDDELEKNELKRHISLIKSGYLQDIEKMFTTEIKG
jgi:hypothetical protein